MFKKNCTKCGVSKSLTEFFRNGDRYKSRCKKCTSEDLYTWRDRNRSEYNNYAAMWRAKNPEKQMASEIKALYGLELEQYKGILEKQAYKCSICSKDHLPSAKKGRLAVDHNHKTGRVRGLLCMACNSGIGHFKDSPEILEKAVAYLKKHS